MEAEAAEAEAAAAAAAERLTFSVEYQHEPVLSVVAPAAVHAERQLRARVVQYGGGDQESRTAARRWWHRPDPRLGP